MPRYAEGGRECVVVERAEESTASNSGESRPTLMDPISAMRSSSSSTPSPKGATDEEGPRKTCRISNLMSPPDLPLYESFNSTSGESAMQPPARAKHNPPQPPLSPPISPFAKTGTNISPTPTLSSPVRDPILFPHLEMSSSSPAPLFGPSPAAARFDQMSSNAAPAAQGVVEQRVVDEHVAARPANLFQQTLPPRREDYVLALSFKSDVMRLYLADPHGWLRHNREQLKSDRKTAAAARRTRARLMPQPLAKSHGKLVHTQQPIRSNASRVQKPTVKAKEPREPKPTGRPMRTNPGSARSALRISSTPEPRVRTVAPNREDKDFTALPDYSPPVTSLPKNKPNSLKVDWKGNALDLSRDPYAHLLHPDELSLAAMLRLDCATYLTSKRRIFDRRLDCARKNKEFRKTDAQQACKIDVNKASKLWQAFEKVGWLDLKWMQHHLMENNITYTHTLATA